MNKLLKAIVGLKCEMQEWLDSHADAEGWLDCMYMDEVSEKFIENEPSRYGFDLHHAYAVEMTRLYQSFKCPMCSDVYEYGGKTCDCDYDTEDIKLDDEEAIEWWKEFSTDSATVDESVVLSVLRDDGYPAFVEHFGLDGFFGDTEKSLQDYEFIETAEDAMVWFLAAAHLHHYGGFHLSSLDGWREEDAYQICDHGLLSFFGKDVIDEFVDGFDLEKLKLSSWELEEDEEMEKVLDGAW